MTADEEASMLAWGALLGAMRSEADEEAFGAKHNIELFFDEDVREVFLDFEVIADDDVFVTVDELHSAPRKPDAARNPRVTRFFNADHEAFDSDDSDAGANRRASRGSFGSDAGANRRASRGSFDSDVGGRASRGSFGSRDDRRSISSDVDAQDAWIDLRRAGAADEPLDEYAAGGYYRADEGDVLHSRYVVRSRLGWGVYSTVWRCTDLVSGRDVAVKIQKGAPEYLKAALAEVAILQHLATERTPGAVRLLSHFVAKGPNGKHACLVFDVLGATLLDRLQGSEPCGAPEAKAVLRSLLEALAALHDAGVVHADVKPENIVVEPSLMLIDFGASFCLGSERDDDAIQSVQYRCPEAILDVRPFTAAADVWSVGCVAFELLTSSMLFDPSEESRFEDASSDEAHLAQAMELLGALPRSLTRESEYFCGGVLVNAKVAPPPKGCDALGRLMQDTFGFERREAAEASVFLKRLLDYDPKRRITAAEALQLPWLAADF
ncbi:kinase-like domain-containing protein [Pelagophyceae sp. CCMP2097]|nr:kinase-like domain-containing protein [Pelagophyceae sp. CCMP2097]